MGGDGRGGIFPETNSRGEKSIGGGAGVFKANVAEGKSNARVPCVTHPCVYNAVVLGGWEEDAVVRTVTGWEEEAVVRTLTGSDSLTRYSFGA